MGKTAPLRRWGRVIGMASHGGTAVRASVARTDGAVARLHALTEIAKSSAGARGFDEVLERVAEGARGALDAASLSISVWERDQAWVRVLLNVGQLGPTEEPRPTDETYLLTDHPFTFPMFDEGTGYRFTIGEPVDELGYQEANDRLLGALEKHSCLGVPILLEGRVWGELFAARTADQPVFTADDVDYATAVSAQVAAGIAQAEHLERVARLAYTDPLTGLGNRRAVDDRLDVAMDVHRQQGRVVSLIVVDVNGLKRINDGRGHEAGDRALVHFAGLLSVSAGLVPGSLAGRTGGDEFCIIVEGATADEAVSMARDLCRRANAAMDEGIACGVASTGDPVGDVDTAARLFRLADAAQTRAKRSQCKVPVVAGRGMPIDATVALADAADADSRPRAERGDRRRVRGAGSRSVHRLVEDVLETLDQSGLVDVQDRLEVVAGALSRLVDVCSWWISATTEDGMSCQTMNYSSLRLGLSHIADPEAIGSGASVYPLADYPITRAVLRGGKAVIHADDPTADPSERAIVDACGAVAVVMAGGPDASGRGWLMEMFIDEVSGDVSMLPTALRVLTACALVVPPGGAARVGG